jgi:hypothetical protein
MNGAMSCCLQALGGLVVQRKENQALLIWDHGVLMREKVHNRTPAAYLSFAGRLQMWQQPAACVELDSMPTSPDCR